MPIAFKSRLGRSGRGFRRGTEDIVGSLFGVDQRLAQNAGAFQQGQLDNLLFGTANKRQDFETKVADEGRFNQGLQQLVEQGDPRSLETLQNIFLNRTNPNAPALSKGTTQKTQFLDDQVDALTQILQSTAPGSPENIAAGQNILALRGGRTLGDAALGGSRQAQEADRVEGLANIEKSGTLGEVFGGEAALVDLLKSGLTGSSVKALAETPGSVANLDKTGELTDAKRLTETYKQIGINLKTEVSQSVLELNDEKLDFMRENNPQKIQQADAELELAQEKITEQLQKNTNQASRQNLIQAMIQTQEARRRFFDRKSVNVGDSGLEQKDFLKEVDKTERLLLGAIPNNPEIEAQFVQAPQRFTKADGTVVEKGESVIASEMPAKLVRAIAEDMVRNSRQTATPNASGNLVDLLTAPPQAEVPVEPREPSILENLFGIPTTGQEGASAPLADLSALDPAQLIEGKQEIFDRLNISEPATAQQIATLKSNMNNAQVPAETRELIRQILIELGQ